MIATKLRWISRRNKAKRKKKDTAKLLEGACQHSASSLLQSVPSHLFLWLFASKQINVSENGAVCLRGGATRPVQRMLSCTVHTTGEMGGGGRGGAGFMCRFQMLRNRQGSMMNGRRQPCCQSKVNSLSIRGGEMTPPPLSRLATPTPTRACTSPAQNSSSNATAFDFCLCAFRTPVFGANPLLTSLSILILSFCACLG